jgi:hypothetical protein
MKRNALPLTLPFIIFLCSCAAGFGKSIAAPVVEPQGQLEAPAGAKPLRVRIEPFTDKRSSSTFVVINDRKIESEGDIGVALQQGFEEAFSKIGVDRALFDVPRVSGSILEWSATVNPAFPASTMKATSTILVEVYSAKGNRLFGKKYIGEVEAKHPLMTEEKVTKMLGMAMGHAVSEAVNDSAFESALSRIN